MLDLHIQLQVDPTTAALMVVLARAVATIVNTALSRGSRHAVETDSTRLHQQPRPSENGSPGTTAPTLARHSAGPKPPA
jgi:hypothetical protein